MKTPDRNENGEEFSPLLSQPTQSVEFLRSVCLNSAEVEGTGR